MTACGRPDRPGGWITPAFLDAYDELHDLGWAHSVEAWSPDGELVGGLYGLAIAGLFAGESMFSDARDASKVALVGLVEHLRDCGLEPARRPVADRAPRHAGCGRGTAEPLPRAAGRSDPVGRPLATCRPTRGGLMALSKRARRWLVIGGTSVVVLVVGAVGRLEPPVQRLDPCPRRRRGRGALPVQHDGGRHGADDGHERGDDGAPSTVASTVAATTTTVPPLTTPPARASTSTRRPATSRSTPSPAPTTPTRRRPRSRVVAGGCGVRLRWAPARGALRGVGRVPDARRRPGHHRLHELPHVLQPGRGRPLRLPAGHGLPPSPRPCPASTWTMSCTPREHPRHDGVDRGRQGTGRGRRRDGRRRSTSTAPTAPPTPTAPRPRPRSTSGCGRPTASR